MATDLLTRLVRAPYPWLVSRNSSILRDVVVGQSIEWSRNVIRAGLQLVNELLFLALVFAFLVVASPLPGLLICGTAIALAVGLIMVSHPRIAIHSERKRRAIRLAGVTASEAIGGGRDVRLSAAGPVFTASFASDMDEYSASEAAGRQWQILPRLGIEVIGFAVLVGISLGALRSGTPRAEVAALLALYAVVAVRAIPIVSQAVISIAAIGASLPAVSELRNLLSELPSEGVAVQSMEPTKSLSWQSLCLDRVGFSYPDADRQTLGPLSITFENGRSYGIVGKSGAGKSTLVDLVAGLLPPTKGHLLLDGEPLNGRRLIPWISGIAYVAQTPFLLDASIADNIEFGQPFSTDRTGRLDRAVAAAGLSDMVSGLPDGLATRLGERGLLLSGGQRQRVAIARALYRDVRLLVLDEATSALDSLTEREVTLAIEALKGQMTLLVVAHRLSTVVRLDELILLDAGQIVAQGAHQVLLGTNDLYRSLVQAQSLAEAAGSAA